MSDVTFDMQQNDMNVHHRHVEPESNIDKYWQHQHRRTAERVQEYTRRKCICFTYGDGQGAM